MKRLSNVLDGKLEAIGHRRSEIRRQRITEFGWSDSIRCIWCGDSGRQPDARDAPCHCERGQAIAMRDGLREKWALQCPRRFRSFTLDSHPYPDAADAGRRWLDHGLPDGRPLLLVGPVGVGKTGLAIGVMREAFLADMSIHYGTVPDLMDGLRPKRAVDTYDDVSMRDLQRVGLLLMDDLGAEKASEWQRERIFMILNSRYLDQRPTIITTNYDIEQLRPRIGERSASRLMQSATVVHIDGDDLRLQGGPYGTDTV